jgi:ATP synthase protein I
MEAYARLQRRLLLATLLLSAITVVLTALMASPTTAASLLVGSLAGLLYLWLLGRSVARLGEQSRRLSKIQLLVPVVLVLASSRLPQLATLPALLGFLLYKPAVILQAVFDS